MPTFSVTWAGVPINLDTPQAHDHIETKIPIREVLASYRPVGEWSTGLAHFWHWPRQPHPPRLGQWYYPTGASRWSEFHFLCTSTEYDQFQEHIGTAQTFEMVQGDVSISTDLYMLPPVVLAQFGDYSGLYWCVLVDDRYYSSQLNNCGDLDLTPSTTWATLFSTLASALGITLTHDSIPTAYQHPEVDSAIHGWYESTALLLDAAAYNCGFDVVRNLNGTYHASNYSTSETTITSNLALVDGLLLAGGDSLADDSNADAVLPESVTVTFPIYSTGANDYCNRRWAALPHPITAGDLYAQTVDTSDILDGYSPVSYEKTFHDTFRALYADCSDDSPSNLTALQDLAEQAAEDYLNRLLFGLDEVYPALVAWVPEGIHDITWTWKDGACNTRIKHRPWNFADEELNHGDGNYHRPPRRICFNAPAPAGVRTCLNTGLTVTGTWLVNWQCVSGSPVITYQDYTFEGGKLTQRSETYT